MKNKQDKIIAIGDTHGRSIWKKIVEKNKDASKIIFLGDYFDSFDISFEEQMTNFLSILDYKKKNPEKVVLLFANHEYHYMRDYSNDSYSGYQEEHLLQIETVLKKAIEEDLLKIAHMEKGYLFTHAGLTKTWMENNKIKGGVAAQINLLFKNNPNVFKFTPSTTLDHYGDSITQGPIWVRPRALLSDLPEGFKQVVGHTHQTEITDDLSGKVFFIDVLDNCNQYLIINDGEPSVGTLK